MIPAVGFGAQRVVAEDVVRAAEPHDPFETAGQIVGAYNGYATRVVGQRADVVLLLPRLAEQRVRRKHAAV